MNRLSTTVLRWSTLLLLPVWAASASAAVITSSACLDAPRQVGVTTSAVANCLAAGTSHAAGAAGTTRPIDAFRLSQVGSGDDAGWQRLLVEDGTTRTAGGLLQGMMVGTGGIFTVSSAAWDAYDRLAIGFYVGDSGASDTDWVVFELARDTADVHWSLSAQQVQYMVLYGGQSATPQLVAEAPEPGTLVLAGMALAGLVLTRTRQKT